MIPVGNAPVSRCGSIEALYELNSNTNVDFIMTKTVLWINDGHTDSDILDKKLGARTYHYNKLLGMSCNCVGLKCLGWYEYWRDILFEKLSKPIVISVHPACIDIISDITINNECDIYDINTQCPFMNDKFAIELNISCVNTKYDSSIDDYLEKIFSTIDFKGTKVGLKIAHDTNIDWLKRVVAKYDINWVTAVNTRPGSLGGIRGGIGGAPLRIDNLALVNKLSPIVPVVACGGIFNRKHVDAYVAAGACAAAIGTAYQNDDVEVFDKIKNIKSKL